MENHVSTDTSVIFLSFNKFFILLKFLMSSAGWDEAAFLEQCLQTGWFRPVCPLWRSGVSAMRGRLMLCPLFHMSVPNTFPFTLPVSFCHWGLPHGVDHVPPWEQIILQLLSLFFFLWEKRNAQKRRGRSMRLNVGVLCRPLFVFKRLAASAASLSLTDPH